MTVGSRDESLGSGAELIDRQHRELRALADRLGDIEDEAEDEVLRAMDLIMAFAFRHCYCEEDLMKQYGYPYEAAQRMVEQHRAFMSHARHLTLAFRKGEIHSVQPLRSFLEEFLEAHQSGEDASLAQWILEHGETSGAGA